jgi:hypothetical protein
VLKGRIRGIYLRGEVYWFGKMVNGRRSIVSLETRDYAEALERAREILERPELQPAQAFDAEIERFLKHKFETNRFSKASADTKGYVLKLFADHVKNIPPANVTGHQCRTIYNAAKERVAASTAESYMFTLRSFFNWCVAQNACRRNPALDCRAASTDLFIDFFDEVNFAEILRSLGARLTVISHVKVDWPILTNLRLDPFERTSIFNGKDNDLSFIPPGWDLSSGAWS